MSALALLTAVASAIAAGFLAWRAHLLKTECSGFASAPTYVRGVIFLMAAIFAFHAQAVFFRQLTTSTEFILALGGALYAVAMWANIYLNHRTQAVPGHPLPR